MIRFLIGILVLLVVQISCASETPARILDKNSSNSPDNNREKILDFKVFLNDREVGSHSYRLQQQGENLLVSSTMQLDFTLLMIKKIKYRHQADEVWQGDCLVSLSSQTEKQGKTITVNALSDASGLVVERKEGVETIDGCARGFAYWNPALLNADFLLNAESGEYLPVEISTPKTFKGDITHMLITGPKADIRLQYDAAGNWLSLESELQIGGRLRYQRIAAGADESI